MSEGPISTNYCQKLTDYFLGVFSHDVYDVYFHGQFIRMVANYSKNTFTKISGFYIPYTFILNLLGGAKTAAKGIASKYFIKLFQGLKNKNKNLNIFRSGNAFPDYEFIIN